MTARLRLPLLLLAVLLVTATADSALAQAMRHPFAVGTSEIGGASGGIMGWLLAEQSRFYLMLTSTIRAISTNGSAAWTLAGLSFAYGVFHAAGPGHGKAVIASYMIANERALKRGLVLTGFAALLQGLVAITIVTIAAVIFNATAKRMTDAATIIEQVSYAAIVALGLWLVWRKGRALLGALRPLKVGAFFHGQSTHKGALAFATTDGSNAFACSAHDHVHDHDHDASCGHVHAPDPSTLDNPSFSWSSALATVVAAGARPCSGAILVLVFSLAQGIYWAGIGAALAMAVGTALTTGALAASAVFAKSFAEKLLGTEGGRGLIIARSAEFLAALLVLFVGLGLLVGASMMQGMA